MAKEIKDMGASVRARLLALAKSSGQPFDVLLTRFAHERLLYRLSLSPHAARFVLKGAMLLMTWLEDSQRATRDLDLLGFGDPEPEGLLAVFREVMERDENDGVRFEPDTLRHERIREENDYGGLRFKARATIGGAQIAIVVDIGFGDALEPGPQAITYPGLLDLPPAQLRAYAPETVIAEKFEAMVSIGIANSRLKDYYDIWMLSQTFAFGDDRLARAISATFARRETVVPDTIPEGLSPAYSNDPARQQQWAAFCDNVAIDPGPLAPIAESIAGFLMSHAVAARALPAS
jgi:predicted nucleotidyltransferase component of viral defense system